MEKTIRKAFKYRLRPHQDQIQKMVEFAGCSRFVWNKALSLNLRRLEKKEPLMWGLNVLQRFQMVAWYCL